MTEIFKDIPEFINGYQVSNTGRVKSLFCVIEKTGPWGTFLRTKREKILTASVNGKGYLCCSCGANGKFGIHDLVARTFIGPKPVGQQVRHKDGNRKNNVPSNLEYGTQSENNYDAARHDRFRISRATVAAVRIAQGTQQQIADAFGIHQTQVSRIKRKVSRLHG